MRVMLVPSSVSPQDTNPVQFLTSYLINDTVAIDAGCIGLFRSPREQARIKHILITHTHMDHLASLPTFLENVYDSGPECVTIHGSAAVLDCLRRDIFNDRVWPNFIAMSEAGVPFLRLATLHPRQPLVVEGLTITPIPVNHVVPTLGFVIEDGRSAVLIPSDTGPTEEIWERGNQTPHLKAAFLEVCFPDAMSSVAERALHLTPATFAREVKKLSRDVTLLAMHIKPAFRQQILKELEALALPNVALATSGVNYEF